MVEYLADFDNVDENQEGNRQRRVNYLLQGCESLGD